MCVNINLQEKNVHNCTELTMYKQNNVQQSITTF